MVREKVCAVALLFPLSTVAIAIVSLFAISSTSAIAKTKPPLELCVNHAGSGGCFTTIQGAVGMVPAGGQATIMIQGDNAPYFENVSVSNASISFVGAGPGMTIVDGTNNNSNLPTFEFRNNSNGELHQMTIQNGKALEGSNVSFVQFKGKSSVEVGSLKIQNCEITGGTFPFDDLPEGAIYFDGKTLIIDSTSIVNNVDKGIEIGSIGGTPHAFITNTTISDNATTGNNASASGCGIRVNSGTTVLNNDTITGNHCIGGSGRGQSPTEGGGIFADYPGKMAISNTIIANNTVAGSRPGGPDCFAPGKGVKSQGHNLIKNITDCNIKLTKTDLPIGTDPNLLPLSSCTASDLLAPSPLGTSVVLDKGNPAKPTGKLGTASSDCLPFDECGGVRAKGQCAIGATQ